MLAFAARAAACGAESRKRCDRDASSTRNSKSVVGWRNRQRNSGETVVDTGDVGSGQEGVAGARCVVLVLVLVLIVALGDVFVSTPANHAFPRQPNGAVTQDALFAPRSRSQVAPVHWEIVHCLCLCLCLRLRLCLCQSQGRRIPARACPALA